MSTPIGRRGTDLGDAKGESLTTVEVGNDQARLNRHAEAALLVAIRAMTTLPHVG
jgi:hypothetical protein